MCQRLNFVDRRENASHGIIAVSGRVVAGAGIITKQCYRTHALPSTEAFSAQVPYERREASDFGLSDIYWQDCR